MQEVQCDKLSKEVKQRRWQRQHVTGGVRWAPSRAVRCALRGFFELYILAAGCKICCC